MENKELKRAVLAKCGELARMIGGAYAVNENWSVRRFKNGKMRLLRYRAGSTIIYNIDPTTPESDSIWPLVAKILGIGDEPQKPSNDLLLAAFQSGWNNYRDGFRWDESWEKFVSTLPPDPLEADREYIRESMRIQSTIKGRFGQQFGPFSKDSEAYQAIARLSGLEVGND